MDDDGSDGSESRNGFRKGAGPADIKERKTVLLEGSKPRTTAQPEVDPPPQESPTVATVVLGSGNRVGKPDGEALQDTEVAAQSAHEAAGGQWLADLGIAPHTNLGESSPGPDTSPSVEGETHPSRYRDLKAFLEEIHQPTARRLRAEGVIAKGGMGIVEVVVDTALKRTVARKVMHPDMQDDARLIWLFLREARITGQLDHPNIVPVHEVGVDVNGRLFFTMKRVQGRPLSHIFRKLPSGLLPDETLYKMLGILVKVCDALAFAHSRKVLHCDLKPSNIMVGEFGEVYLMDWGLARTMTGPEPDMEQVRPPGDHALSTSCSVMGTPAYMSPEQANGARETLDCRSDVFAMGAILYHLLCRRPPFNASTFDETVALARRGAFVPPSGIVGRQAVPGELERIVLKAMATDPDDRYSEVNGLKHDLEHFMFRGGEFPQAHFSKGDHIIHEGQLGESAYIIVSGECEVYRMIDDNRVSIRTMGPGELFGETAILSPGPRTANVVALTDTTLYVVTAEVLATELDGMKPWLARLIRTLAERFRELEKQRGG